VLIHMYCYIMRDCSCIFVLVVTKLCSAKEKELLKDILVTHYPACRNITIYELQ